MSSDNQGPPSQYGQNPPPGGNPGYPYQGPPSLSGQGQPPNGNPGQPYPNPPSGQFPGGNPAYQGPPSLSGQGPLPNGNPGQPYPNPPSGQFPGGNPAYQGPPSLSGQGPLPNGNPGYPYQGPPSLSGQGPLPSGNPAFQNQSAPPQFGIPDDKKEGVSRRNLLRVSAIVGGSLAAIGGVAYAARQVMTPTAPASKPVAVTQPTAGQLREYWVQADSFLHNMVPTGKDGMMNMPFLENQSSYWAVGYKAYTPNWGKPLTGNDDIGANTGIPGPVFRGSVGDTIRVHFRNNDTHYNYPHSMHPHGVIYTPANNGAWVASDPQPGGAVEVGKSYTYEWKVRPNSVGTWVYHDHGPSVTVGANMLMEFGVELGLFGLLVLTDASTPPVKKEFFTFLHDLFKEHIPELSQDYDCFNGYSYLNNTPTFTAKVGDTIRWHIGALGQEFHAFHLHGHRWSSNGQFVDVVQIGPSNATSFDFVADNPGKWLYHCHVTDHMMGGMMGMYIITEK